jgi:hypothetical protein
MQTSRFFSRFAGIGALCALVFISACATQGPAGPAGPQGPIGPVGPQGTGGASARVVNISVAATSWAAAGAGGPGAYLQSGWFTSSNITSEILNSGVVLVYSQVNDANTAVVWQQLPITYYDPGVLRVVDAQYRANQVQIFINSSDSNVPPRPTGALNYRVVAISGTTTAKLQQQVDITNYAAVKSAFHLAE